MQGKDKTRIIVAGGGPAGSFFAIHVLKEAKHLNRDIEVIIIEKKKFLKHEDNYYQYKGCNFGAGGISPKLNEIMEQSGINIPPEIIQGEIKKIWINGRWKNFPIKVPKEMKMYSVFRGSLPSGHRHTSHGLDAFLLEKAIENGAHIIHGEVQYIGYTDSGTLYLKTKLKSGELQTIPASFAAVSTGVNARQGKDYRDSEIVQSIRRINPYFVPNGLRKTIVFELKVGQKSLEKNLNNEVYFIEYGSKEFPIEHISLLPKRDYLTVAAIGGYIDRADLPKETLTLIKKIVGLPQLKKIVPNIAGCPVVCACSPMMTTDVAVNPYAERLALIGDAVGSRLYKDGLYSAYLTASQLAKTIMHEGTDKKTLAREYGKTVRWLSNDNRFGKVVFRLIRLTFSTSLLSRVLYQAFATELKIKDKNKRPLGKVLWNIASGTADYKVILKNMFSYRVLRSTLIGGLVVTLRNKLAELLFGLKWGKYGNYPTVILKEKKDYFKESISSTLGINLDPSPEFERMYAIKIKAHRKSIFEELGKFGDDRRSYLRLRSVEITRTAGRPNQKNSIIRYKVKFLPVSVDMHLKHVVPEEVLWYEVSEKFADRGKLIFELKPTKDGNIRFVIYTAFDYKKGKRWATQIFWKFFRLVFPAFLHDIVWNHALCSIKETAELKEEELVTASEMPYIL